MLTIDNCIANFTSDYTLGVDPMDVTHREFLTLVQQANSASKGGFAPVFNELFQHTQAHFRAEESVMAELDHGARAEHRSDHQRILGEMERFNQKVASGRHTMARAWVADTLVQWFHTHAQTMDSALAADIKARATVKTL